MLKLIFLGFLCILSSSKGLEDQIVFQFSHDIISFYNLKALFFINIVDDVNMGFWSNAKFSIYVRFLSSHQGLNSIKSIPENRIGIFCSTDCSESLLIQASKIGLLENYLWFIPNTINSTSIPLRLDSEVYFYSEINQSGIIQLSEKYRIKNYINVEQSIGTWSKQTGLVIPESRIFERRKNLRGVKLIAGTYANFDYFPIARISTTANVTTVVGFVPKVLDALIEETNSNLIKIPANDVMTAVMGLLIAKITDISIMGVTLKSSRARYIDFSLPLYEQTWIITSRMSTKKTLNIWAFIKAFQIPAWIGVGLILIILGVGITFLLKKITNSEIEDSSEETAFSYLNGMSVVVISLFQLRYEINMVLNGIKFVYLIICLFGFLIYAHYAANLTSEMTILRPKDFLKSYEQLLGDEYTLIIMNNSNFHIILKASRPPSIFYRIYNEKVLKHPENIYNDINVMENVLKSDPEHIIAFGPESMALYGELAGSFTNIKLPSSPGRNFACLGYQKNSEFTKFFDYHILKLKQMGILDHIWKRVTETERIQNLAKDETPTANALNYDNLFFPFFIMGCGIFISIIFAISEKYFKKTYIQRVRLSSFSRRSSIRIFNY